MTNSALTTEIAIDGDRETLVGILNQQYGRLESGEARTALEQNYPDVCNDEEFSQRFAAEYFDPPYVHVIERETKNRGTMMYVDAPRFYFLFVPTDQSPEAANVS